MKTVLALPQQLLSPVFPTSTLGVTANHCHGKLMKLLNWLLCNRQPIACEVVLHLQIFACQAIFPLEI